MEHFLFKLLEILELMYCTIIMPTVQTERQNLKANLTAAVDLNTDTAKISAIDDGNVSLQ
jgi:hypothetical protein